MLQNVQEREMEGEEDVLAKQEAEEEDEGEEVESSLMLHMKNWTVLSQLQESTEIVTTQEVSYE